MGLIGDYKELENGWKNISLLGKIIGAAGLFLAVTSLANLAEPIIIWRGLIKDGLELYANLFSEPVVALFGWLDFCVSKFQLDLMVLLVLSSYPSIALFIQLERNRVINKGGKDMLNERDFHPMLSRWKGSILIEEASPFLLYVSITIILLILVLFSFRIDDFDLGLGVFGIFFYSWLVSCIYCFIMLNASYKKVFLRPIMALLIVLLLAAINKGITTPI